MFISLKEWNKEHYPEIWKYDECNYSIILYNVNK